MSALAVRVLGPLVATCDGQELELGGPRPRAALATLVAARGRAVPAERLLRAVWWQEPGAGSRATLAAYVSRLRRALATADPEARIVAVDGGYRLDLPAGCLDAERFVAAGERARLLHERGDLAGAAAACAEALALWRGEPFTAACSPTVEHARARLTEARWAVRERAAAVALEQGDAHRVVEDLGADVEREPRARALELLVTALYRCGRQTEALRTLRTLRDRVDGSAEPLHRLEADLLRQEPALAATPAVPVQQSADRARTATAQVPTPLSSFVGRDREVEAVRAALREERLVTLVGSGGAGKTRLAVEVVRAGGLTGAVWAPLAAVRDGADVRAAVADALGVSSGAGVDPLEAVAVALGDATCLLVLDNGEHLLTEVADLAVALLSRCPGVRLLVTTRRPLGLPGERVVEVAPLPLTLPEGGDGPAVRLFLDRVEQVTAGWAPTGRDLEDVRLVCRALDGLPLALELAAARCGALSPAGVLAGLEDRFALLQRPPGLHVEHHSRLYDAIAWSYALLEADVQQVFRALAVFAGGFDLEAAQAVVGRSVPVLLADLVDQSLVTVDRSARPRRYALLESVRDFARSRCSTQEWVALCQRHVAWTRRLAERTAGELTSGPPAAPMRRFDTERADLVVAVERAVSLQDAPSAVAIAADLCFAWYRSGRAAEGVRVTRSALAAGPVERPQRVRAQSQLSHLLTQVGQSQAALAAALEAAEQLRDDDDLALRANVEMTAAWMLAAAGHLEPARARAERALQAGLRQDSPQVRANCLLGLGVIAYGEGALGEAQELLARASAAADLGQHHWCAGAARTTLAKALLRSGDAEGALELAVDAHRRGLADEDRLLALGAALIAAGALAASGRGEQAACVAGAADVLAGASGFPLAQVDRVDAEHLLHRVRTALPPSALSAQWARGRTWTAERLAAALDALAGEREPTSA